MAADGNGLSIPGGIKYSASKTPTFDPGNLDVYKFTVESQFNEFKCLEIASGVKQLKEITGDMTDDQKRNARRWNKKIHFSSKCGLQFFGQNNG